MNNEQLLKTLTHAFSTIDELLDHMLSNRGTPHEFLTTYTLGSRTDGKFPLKWLMVDRAELVLKELGHTIDTLK